MCTSLLSTKPVAHTYSLCIRILCPHITTVCWPSPRVPAQGGRSRLCKPSWDAAHALCTLHRVDAVILSLLLLSKRRGKKLLQQFGHIKKMNIIQGSHVTDSEKPSAPSFAMLRCAISLTSLILSISHLLSGLPLHFEHSWQGTIAHYRGIHTTYFNNLILSSDY